MEQPVIDVRNVVKIYRMGSIEVPALRGVSLRVFPGELAAIMGPSGSGKSTLMNILGCLDRPTSGTYILDGQEVSRLDDNALAHIRKIRKSASSSRPITFSPACRRWRTWNCR